MAPIVREVLAVEANMTARDRVYLSIFFFSPFLHWWNCRPTFGKSLIDDQEECRFDEVRI